MKVTVHDLDASVSLLDSNQLLSGELVDALVDAVRERLAEDKRADEFRQRARIGGSRDAEGQKR